jgi:enterochelin esterase-like enzyme
VVSEKLFALMLVVSIAHAVSVAQPTPSPTPQNLRQLQPPDIMPLPARVNADRSITFSIWAPRATTVSVDGDFLLDNRSEEAFPMTKGDSGVWTITLGPIEPEIWRYSFILDGVEIPGSYVRVPADSPQFYDAQPGQYGSIHIHSYDSKSLGVRRTLYVYTPPGYKNANQVFPVLILLHPGGHTESAWLNIGRANVILDNLINQGKARPMVVVMPFGYPIASSEAGESPDHSTRNHPQFAKDLYEDVIPLVEKNYSVSQRSEHRAVTGASMGGLQSLTICLDHLDKFRWFGSFSGLGGLGPDANLEQTFRSFLKNNQMAQKDVRLLWFAAGEKEINVFKRNQQFSELLTKYQIKHTFASSPKWSHVWQLWRRNLCEFSQLLFKD